MAKKHGSPSVARWRESTEVSPLDAELGEVFRALEHEEPLSEPELLRVGRRLAHGRRRVASRKRALPRLMLAFAVLVGASSVALAQWRPPGFWQLRAFLTHSLEPAHAGESAKVTKAGPPQARIEKSSAGLAPTPEPALAPEPGLVAPTPSAAPAEISTTAAAPAGSSSKKPSALALESALLQKALAKLRREHNGAAALALLNDYQSQFPRGQLAAEASAARVDALLLSGKRADALALLTRLPLDSVGRRTELRLLRAELYAERDCRQALPDFDAVLNSAAGSGLAERALYGRAACRLRLGDGAGGRADLESYVQRYPSGRFAEQVRARLGSR